MSETSTSFAARDRGRESPRRRAARASLAVALLAAAAACTPRVHAVAAPEPPPAPPALEGEPLVLRGYLGHAPIDAALVATESGFHGCYRALGTSSRTLLDGTRTETPAAEDASDASEPEEPREFACRFEARSDLARLGGIVARCVLSPEREWEVNGALFSAKDGAATPFFLGPTTYPSAPDALLLALGRGETSPHACAPFIDLLDVKTLPRDRTAVLYAESYPCEAQASDTDEPRLPVASRLRLALFRAADPAHPHLVVVPGEDEGETATLASYELAPGLEFFVVDRQTEVSENATGRTYREDRPSLFALTRGGRAGPALELPEVQNYETGCDRIDSVNLRRVELDKDAPPALVVELEHTPEPCSDNGEPTEPSQTADAAYAFDPESARFTPLAVEDEELERRTASELRDASRADDTWRALPAEDPCSSLPR